MLAPVLAATFAVLGLAAPEGRDAAPPAPTGCTGRLEARVVDADTGEEIPGARVELKTPSKADAVLGTTDDQGVVRFGGLCPGTAEVEVAKSEHVDADETFEVGEGLVTGTVELVPLHAHHAVRVVVVHDESSAEVAATEQLAGADLAEARGEGLADAISGMAGVTTLRGTAGGMAKPVIRGQVGRRNLILVDGIPHAGQSWGLDHAPEVDPYAAGRITVVKGAATTRYGPGAIGGVVLVEPRPLPREPGLSGEVSTVGDSNALGGGGAFRLDHAPARWRGFAWRVEGDVSRSRAILTPDYPLDNTGALTWNVGTRLGYLRDAFDVEASYRLLRTRAGICTCLRAATGEDFTSATARGRPIGVELYEPGFPIERPRQEIWHHLAVLRSRVDLQRAGELHFTYAFQLNDREEFDIVRESISGPQVSLALATHDGEAQWEQPTVDLGRAWTLVGGVGGRVVQQTHEFDASTTLVPDYRQWSGGPFVVERFVHERVELEVGARYEGMRRDVSLEERDFLGQSAGGRLDESACATTDDGGADCAKTHHAPSGAVGVLVRPVARAPELTVRVDANSSARIPSIDEQYMNGAAPSFPILGLGSAKLGIERTWGGTTTLQYDGDWLFVEGSAYANYIHDYIYFRPSPQTGQCAPLTCTTRGPLPVFAFESVNAMFGGGEVRLGFVAPELPFEVSATGSWVRAQDLTHDGPVNLVPPDRYTLVGRYWWPDTKVSARGYLELDGVVADRQRRFDPDADFTRPPPAYVLLGAGVGVEFPADDYLVRVSARGHNLLDRRYREYTNLLRYFVDEPGWGVQLRLSIDFDVPRARAG